MKLFFLFTVQQILSHKISRTKIGAFCKFGSADSKYELHFYRLGQRLLKNAIKIFCIFSTFQCNFCLQLTVQLILQLIIMPHERILTLQELKSPQLDWRLD